MDKSVLYGLSYGMYVVGASDAGRPVGCIINTCIQITSDEPVLAVSLNKNNYTLSAVKRTRRFGLSVIAERTDRSIIPILGSSAAVTAINTPLTVMTPCGASLW